MIFIDWLTVSQEYPAGSLPVVGAEWRTSTDIRTGEIVYRVVTGFQHEGSYDTSIHIRCDGSRVQVSGNPSAFGRVDNVFGFTTVDDALAVYNRCLVDLGLPAFAPTDYSRPKISRIDLTVNLRSGGVLETLRLLSGFCVRGKAAHLYANGRTVDWFRGSRRLYVKFYCKAFDLRDKARALARRLKRLELQTLKSMEIADGSDALSLDAPEISEETGREIDLSMYRTREEVTLAIQELSGLIDYAESVSLVRWEVSLKQKLLIELGLDDVEKWRGIDMGKVIDRWAFHKQARFEETKIVDLVGFLIGKGYTPRQARAYAGVGTSWMMGKDVHYRSGWLSRNGYYRAREALLFAGIDIANPPNVAAMPLRTVSIKCEPLSPPEWYTLPKVA